MREPRYPLPRVVCDYKEARYLAITAGDKAWHKPFLSLIFLGTFRAGGCCFVDVTSFGPKRLTKGAYQHGIQRIRQAPNTKEAQMLLHVLGSFCYAGFDNDPSAGSPTETLLRLLLPLNDKVQWNSRDVAGGEPPTSPRS